jgi:hypothetical protein
MAHIASAFHCRIRRRGIAALAIIAVAGCASFQDRDASTEPFPGFHRLVLVEIPMLREEAWLREQFADELPRDSPAARQAIDEAVNGAEISALASMQKALVQREGVTIDDSEATVRTVKDLGLDNPDVVVSPDIARRLRAASGADGLLRFRITDYGITPKAWRTAYIAFEVVSTLAIAGIAYAYPKTRPIAGVYLVEEIVEETLEGYGGFWVLNKVCRPVRIEAEWTSLYTGATVWKDSATGLSDIRPARLVRKVGQAEADAQRAQAIDKAVKKLAAEIVEAGG